jgi:pyridoxamine 5'-phosphate oxidase
METSPIVIFNKWFDEELNLTKVRIPSPRCLFTISIDNYPNARIVLLKDITENNLIDTKTTKELKEFIIKFDKQVKQ